jgi:hypothetical protein
MAGGVLALACSAFSVDSDVVQLRAGETCGPGE